MKRPLRAFALAVAALEIAAYPASARQVGAPELQARSPRVHGTAVAVALRVPSGSSDDAPGLEGTAWLLGRVLEDQVTAALGSTPAVFRASVSRSAMVFTLVAEPWAWEEAWRRADSVIFDVPLDPALVERHRASLIAAEAFEEGSPYQEFEGGAASLLAEPGSPFARPPRGTEISLSAMASADLERFRAAFVRRSAGAWAAVGPLPPARARAPERPVLAERPSGIAWETRDRTALARDVTSTWIAIAYPASTSLPRTHLELLAHLLEEELEPTPPPPDRYSVSVRVEDAPPGPVLLVEATVAPEAAAAWESRILGAVERLAAAPMAEDFFRWRRRRFRTERLLAESAPEAEAARMTEDLLRDGRVRDLGVEIWKLDARALLAAARSLGPPRIFVLGPDLGPYGSRAP